MDAREHGDAGSGWESSFCALRGTDLGAPTREGSRAAPGPSAARSREIRRSRVVGKRRTTGIPRVASMRHGNGSDLCQGASGYVRRGAGKQPRDLRQATSGMTRVFP